MIRWKNYLDDRDAYGIIRVERIMKNSLGGFDLLTITLDEQGDFEDLRNKLNEEPVFIGGIIYDDEDWNEEFEKEQLRLEAYLQNVCESVGARYPRDLHYEALENGGNNSSSVRLVKKKMGETLQEFLQNGTWNGNYIAGVCEVHESVFLRGVDKSVVGAAGSYLCGQTEVCVQKYDEACFLFYAEDCYAENGTCLSV